MNRVQVAEILTAKFERTGGEDWVEELIEKANTIPEEVFANCSNFGEIRVAIETYRKPSNRTVKTDRKTTYFELIAPIDSATDKAIGIVTGENNKHGNIRREYVQWISKSQVIEEEGKTFIPSWIVSKNMMWNVVNKDSKITR